MPSGIWEIQIRGDERSTNFLHVRLVDEYVSVCQGEQADGSVIILILRYLVLTEFGLRQSTAREPCWEQGPILHAGTVNQVIGQWLEIVPGYPNLIFLFSILRCHF